MTLMHFIYVALGGALGSCARYALVQSAMRLALSWPLGTLLVNIIGSLLMGLLAGAMSRGVIAQQPYWPLLATGVLGGFTTFSAFSLDMLQLVEKQGAMTALGYVLLSVGGGLICVYLGWLGARYVG